MDFERELNVLRAETEMYNKQKEQMYHLADSYKKGIVKYQDLVTTQRLLVTLSDKHFNEIITYISEIINKALLAMYPDDNYRFNIARKLYQGKSVHLNVIIEEFIQRTGRFEDLDIKRNIGNGQAQVISYLFTLCMYKVSYKRPIILLDEILTGFHEVALEYVIQITKVFAEEGFQFITVEYSFENFGTPVLIRKDGTTGNSTIEESTWEDVENYFQQVIDNRGSQIFEEGKENLNQEDAYGLSEEEIDNLVNKVSSTTD